MDWRSLQRNTRRLATVVATIACAVLILVLSLEVKALRPQARELKRMRAVPTIGQWVPRVDATAMDGSVLPVGETSEGRTQLLVFFTVSCPYCRQNLTAWRSLTDSLRSDPRTEVIWVSLSPMDSTKDFVRAHAIESSVVVFPDRRASLVYRVKGVPVTMVVDAQGMVTSVHPSLIESTADLNALLLAARTPRAAITRTSARDLTAGVQ